MEDDSKLNCGIFSTSRSSLLDQWIPASFDFNMDKLAKEYSAQKAYLLQCIVDASNPSALLLILNNVNFADLQSFVQDQINNLSFT